MGAVLFGGPDRHRGDFKFLMLSSVWLANVAIVRLMSVDYEQRELFEGHYNHEKTQENAKNFLSRTYPRALRIAGAPADGYQSPQWSAMPKGTPSGNRTEERLLRRAAALEVVRATENTIERCDRWGRPILQMLYLERLNDDLCMDKLGYGRTQYFTRLKPNALEQFAEAFPLWDLVVNDPGSTLNPDKPN